MKQDESLCCLKPSYVPGARPVVEEGGCSQERAKR